MPTFGRHAVGIFFLCFTALIAPAASVAYAQNCGFYTYKALITEVYDGDTVTADIDLGFHTWRRDEKLRLYEINAPEMRGNEKQKGIVSRDALRKRILGRQVTICTIKDKRGKYGRYLAKIFIGGESINDWLVKNGFANYRVY